MIDTVGELGYAKTTVADVHARAGVSRKAFYEHFSNKEECFLETYDAVVAEGLERVSSASRTMEHVPDRAQACIEALFEQAIESPRVLRLVMIEIGALGPAGVERRERLMTAYEQLMRENLGLACSPGAIAKPTLRAILGGLSKVLYTRLQSGREEELRKLVPALVWWVTSYYSPLEPIVRLEGSEPALPPGGHIGGRAPGTLWPSQAASKRRGLRGEPKGSRSFVVHNQRERILDAVANLSSAKGYAAITVKDIAGAAAVSPDTFYEHFTSKEDAFLVAYELGHGKGLAVVERAYADAPDWRFGVRAAIAALFDFLASEPAFAHMSIVDALIATSRTAERSASGVTSYAEMLVPGLEEAPGGKPPPPVTIEAIAGGMFELCLTYALQNRIAELSELVPRATYFALAPFIGAEEAGRIATAPQTR